VRAFAASALRLIGDRSLVPLLREKTSGERDGFARDAMREAIATLEGGNESPRPGSSTFASET